MMDRKSASREAFKKRDTLLDARSGSLPDVQPLDRTSPLFSYIFKLQVDREKTGSMDYRSYADKMWRELLGSDPAVTPELYQQFEADLITGLDDIDMSAYVYEHVTESLAKLIETYIDRLKKIFLWSTGDVSGTGYQVLKINRSHIVEKFYRALSAQTKKDGLPPRELLEDKAGYIVDDNKFTKLCDVLRSANLDQTKPHTIVIIEDSVKNFDKAAQTLREQLPDYTFNVIPLWALYSREGINAKKELSPEDFAKQKEKLNGIESFDDLLDQDRFGSMLERAIVLVDFDGVIGDNIKMRDEQARVIYRALLHAGHQLTGADLETHGARFTMRAREFLKRT